MRKITKSYRFKAVFSLTAAVCMALAYPVHVVVDHTGFFQNHSHHHGDEAHHPVPLLPDDELCAFCVTLGSIEVPEAADQISACGKELYFPERSFIRNEKPAMATDARAPPA